MSPDHITQGHATAGVDEQVGAADRVSADALQESDTELAGYRQRSQFRDLRDHDAQIAGQSGWGGWVFYVWWGKGSKRIGTLWRRFS